MPNDGSNHSTNVRRRKRAVVVVLIGLAVSATMFVGCVQFGPPSPDKAFEGRPMPTEHRYFTASGRSVSARETGLEDGPLVLFAHGSPGAWNDFAHVMADPRLAARARLVSIDRLGWGGSADGGLAPAMADQAAALAAVLDAHPLQRPAIVVGHSLGGPVAARVAMDRPDAVDAVLIVAGSIDPELEETTWFQELGRTWLIAPIVPEMLSLADEEIRPLRAELEGMLPSWSRLAMPITILQGEDDALVPAANADFAERVITGAPLRVERIPDQGHLIPWERPELIVEALLRQLDELDELKPPRGSLTR